MNFAALVALVKPLIALGGTQAQKQVERWLTPPKSQRTVLYKGMGAEDVEEAERLRRRFADAGSDYACFVASRGAIEADDAEYSD